MSSNLGASLRRRLTTINRQLRDAAGAGNTARVVGLLAKGADADARDDEGNTPLHCASYNGHVDAIEALLYKGADVNAKDNRGDTPLHDASHRGHVDAAAALVARGAAVNAENNDRLTPLHYASANGHVDAIDALLIKGADVNAKNNQGDTPLHGASQNGHADVAMNLLARGAGVDAENNDRLTPLHYASSNGYVDAIEALLFKGADVNAKNNLGDTPLHGASYDGHVDAAAALLAGGAGVDVGNNGRVTPLHYASAKGHRDVAMTLLAQGADPEAPDGDGNTPVYLAELWGKDDVLELLMDTIGIKLEFDMPVPPRHEPGSHPHPSTVGQKLMGNDEIGASLAAIRDDLSNDEIGARLVAIRDDLYGKSDAQLGGENKNFDDLAARLAALGDDGGDDSHAQLGGDNDNFHDLEAELAALKDNEDGESDITLGEGDRIYSYNELEAGFAALKDDGDRRADEPDAMNPSPSQAPIGVGKDDYLHLKMVLELARDGVTLPDITDEERTALRTLVANMPDLERSLESVRGLPPSLADKGDKVSSYFFFFCAAFERLFVAAQAITSGACKVDVGMASNILEAALGAASWAAEGSNLPFAGFVGIFSAVIKHQAETKKTNSLEAFVEFFRGNSRDQYLLTYRRLAEQFCLQRDVLSLNENEAASTKKAKERVKELIIIPIQKYLRKVHLDSIRMLSPVEEKAMSDLAYITEEVLRLHQNDKETYDQLRLSDEQAKASYFTAHLFGQTSPTPDSESSNHSSANANSSKPPPREGEADPEEDAESIQLLMKKMNELEELKESFQSHINANANVVQELQRTQAQVRKLAAKMKSKKDITLSSGRQAQAQIDSNLHREEAKKVKELDKALVKIDQDLRNLHVKYSQDMAKLKVENFINKKLISRHEAFEVMRKIISLTRGGDEKAIVVSEDGTFVLNSKVYRIGVVKKGRPFAKKKILWKGNGKIKLEEEYQGAKSVMHWFDEMNLSALYERKKWEAIRAVFAEEMEEPSIPDTTEPNHHPRLEDDRDELFHTGPGLR